METAISDYLAELPEDRREAIDAVRTVITAHLPDGVVESLSWGMISYEIPLATYSPTYNGKPLLYAALASQKNYMSLYLNCAYAAEPVRAEFERAYRESGKRMDLGKSCVRFRQLDDLPLEAVGEAIGAMTVSEFLAAYEDARSPGRTRTC